MTEASFQVDGPQSKRRKVRKGTQSCWECRRRKVSCTLAMSNNAVCENCKRRGTACISQEHPDEVIPSTGSTQIESRLSRVEELVEHLAHGAITNETVNLGGKCLSGGPLSQLEPKTLAGFTPDQCADKSTLSGTKVDSGVGSSCNGNNMVEVSNTNGCIGPRPALERSSTNTVTSLNQIRPLKGKYEDVSLALIAAWPSQCDIDLICLLPVGLSAHLYGGICAPYSSFLGQDPPSPQKMLQLPPPGSHPVLIARKLLLLGTFLQASLASSILDVADGGAFYRHIMYHAVDTAIRLVTSNEDLIGSVEGIDCIMIEAMYKNYVGDLRGAWTAVRKATTVAQLMMLHRGLKSPSLKILHPKTRANFDAEQICFRVVQMDCYLSLMLGLPRASLETHFATAKALEKCQPIDRMQRIHCVISIRILQQNERNISEIHDIDKLLQKAASEMPPQWWLIPHLSVSNSGDTKDAHDTVRLLDQITHYHLLIRLHLPYMLHSSTDCRYEHSKTTAVHASRETLVRFAAFHTSTSTHFYCRGTDYLAFIATTVLCLAYIDFHGCYHHTGHNSNTSPNFNSLAHSRPNDRGVMEHTLDILESMANAGKNSIAAKLAFIIHHLLAIEASAANGNSYSTNSSVCDAEELECHGRLFSDGKGLRIHIPSIGTINFERHTTSSLQNTQVSLEQHSVPIPLMADILIPAPLDAHNQPLAPIPDCVVASHIHSKLDTHKSDSDQLKFGQLPDSEDHPAPGSYNPYFSCGDIQEDQLSYPIGVADAEDESDLYGIEVALFDSLFNGTGAVFSLEERENS